MALALALASPSLEVVGVTIVMDNHSDVHLLAANAAKVMALCGRRDIPIYVGAEHPLAEEYHGHSGIHVHGQNGLGGTELDMTDAIVPSSEMTAAEYLVHATAGGDISLIALGPLTNVALAIQADPEFAARIPVFSLMGGTVDGVGNASPSGEANFINDPEAAAIVFDAPFPAVIMAGLNATRQVPLSDSFRAAIKATGSPVADFAHAASAGYIAALAEWNALSYVHDSTAVMALVRPDIFTSKLVAVRVETKGEITRGTSVADFSGIHWPGARKNVHVLMTVDTQAYYDHYVARIATYAAHS
ncbi:inosine-uridine nucleoside N-ribohydrolase [Thecamonas trahens ATCC 50062]|uniref:Inosine-uridine nucleoside N-ribohydrolase n=1 Tax=Thecamonas trahens ATCC 50062 TaxID=461836 RepID=A0A0L0D1J4_THETB|nr:inosine-uridine nucleoside N-ribohydrolase [Thecamonas trahens ATCC 50062]KNC46229.1 inosine-uridine nucleoside N-ribohydrolase [Thecamonas trahens ATCC 50062]|eukprot:XP_013760526.1 inosine-uridine nucleoside N-ribohydrolase [Thecamonas trahens ATCC 50062]